MSIKVIKFILLFFLILILINVLYSKYIRQDSIIKVFGHAFLIVATGSMEPTICSEELIIIKEKDNYKTGDIVTYIDEDGFMITHRIVEIYSNSFVTKGDANNIKDELCENTRIQGKVIFHSKILGFFILYLLKPICVIYGVSSIIIELLRNRKKGGNIDEKECKI